MLRSLYWLPIACLGALFGCSDPVPAAAAVGLRLGISPSGTCAPSQVVVDDLGDPPPDRVNRTKGRPFFDGSHGVQASCSVVGETAFTVSANVKSPGVGFTLDAMLQPNGTSVSGSVSMSINSAALSGTIAGSGCSINVVSDTGPGVQPGALWAAFDCIGLRDLNSTNVTCNARGEILLENCSRK